MQWLVKLKAIDNIRKELEDLQQITEVLSSCYFRGLFYKFRLNKLVGIFVHNSRLGHDREFQVPNTIIPDINKLIESRIDQIKKELEYYFKDNNIK